MADLGLDYIDLYLIHAPWPWEKMGMDCTEGNIECWKAIEEIYESGKAKAIGVSNFAPEHMQPILDNCKIVPMVDQVSFHIGNRQEAVVAMCKEHDIQLMAYSPLATGGLDKCEICCKKLLKNTMQQFHRFVLDIVFKKGAIAIPKSTKEERIISNVQVEF